jgi:hypothetical protein
MKTKPIGGELSSRDIDSWLNKEGGTEDFEFYFPGKPFFFQTGTDAMAASVLSMAKQASLTTFWAPVHFCNDTISRLILKTSTKTNLQIKRYKSLSDLKERKSHEIFLFVHFNGYDPEISAFIEKQNENDRKFFLEDFVHAPFSMNRRLAGYSFNCLRKGLSRDVSVAYGNFVTNGYLPGETSKFHQIVKEARDLKSNDPVHNENLFLSKFDEGKTALHDPSIYKAATSYVENARHILWRQIEQRRQHNYQTLFEIFSKHDFCEIIPGESMYFMMKVAGRDRLRAFCKSKMMFFPVHWLDAKTPLSDEIISLVIDQRYGPDDMRTVAQAILEFYGKNP